MDTNCCIMEVAKPEGSCKGNRARSAWPEECLLSVGGIEGGRYWVIGDEQYAFQSMLVWA